MLGINRHIFKYIWPAKTKTRACKQFKNVHDKQWGQNSNKSPHKLKPETIQIHWWIHYSNPSPITLQNWKGRNSYKVRITQVTVCYKHTMKNEKCRSGFLMNKDAKFLNEILTNRLQDHFDLSRTKLNQSQDRALRPEITWPSWAIQKGHLTNINMPLW